MPCRLRKEKVGEFTSIRIENDLIAVGVIPELGGKIYSILDTRTETEFVWKNPYKAYKRPRYGAAYQEFDSSGIDECIPTVEPCTYPDDPWKGIEIPDHGEVWSIPWKYQPVVRTRKKARIRLDVCGIRFPYQLTKEIALAEGKSCVNIQYKLVNHSHKLLLFVWALHSLLNVDEASRILLPRGTRAVVTSSKNQRLLQDEEFLWPLGRASRGNDVDLSYVGSLGRGFADKIVTTRITDGWCALCNERSKVAAVLSFPRESVTNIGVWINLGGWGNPGHPEHNNVALEPQIGWDQLDLGYSKYHRYGVLQPSGSQTWKVDIDIIRDTDPSSILG